MIECFCTSIICIYIYRERKKDMSFKHAVSSGPMCMHGPVVVHGKT